MKLELLDHQFDFLSCQNKFALLLGGIGSGKSFAGAIYAFKMAMEFPKCKGAIFANSYKQLTTATLKTLFDFMTENHISFSFNQQNGILTIERSHILCRSLDNYDLLRGVEIGWYWYDEAAYGKQEAFEVINGRLREKKAPLQGRLTTTPKGYNWVYDYFEGDKKTEQFSTFQASTKANTFLPDGYYESLKSMYSSRFIDQELEGKFVNVNHGAIYFAFDRKKLKIVSRDPSLPVYVGMDFNINPMSAVVANLTGKQIRVFDEVSINSSNTHEMAKYLLEKYGRCIIIPDATGKAIKTSSAGLSDHEILRQHGHKIESNKNPFRVDRYNTVNNLLELGQLEISSSCVKLIKDLERLTYKQGTNLPDLVSDDLGHISDGLGYLCFWYSPLVPSRKVGVKQYA